MTTEAFDFRKPPPTALENKVEAWLSEMCRFFPKEWPKVLAFSCEVQKLQVESRISSSILDELPESTVAYRLSSSQSPDEAPIFAIPRPLMIGLIGASLGVPPAKIPDDRELTSVEVKLSDFLIQQLFLVWLSKSWPFQERPTWSIQARGIPKEISRLPSSDLSLFVTITIVLPFDTQKVYFILPRSGSIMKLMKANIDAPVVKRANPEQIESLVREMAVDLSVILGSVQISMLQLASLQAGDLIVLEQKVSEPLRAKVAGTDKFDVWPGAVGRRQAICIDSMVAK